MNWTPLREQTLALLRRSTEPMSAYAIAEAVTRQTRTKVDPSSMYRLLKLLVEALLVVNIATWNRYLVSPDPRQEQRLRHGGRVSIDRVLLAPRAIEALDRKPRSLGADIAAAAKASRGGRVKRVPCVMPDAMAGPQPSQRGCQGASVFAP